MYKMVKDLPARSVRRGGAEVTSACAASRTPVPPAKYHKMMYPRYQRVFYVLWSARLSSRHTIWLHFPPLSPPSPVGKLSPQAADWPPIPRTRSEAGRNHLNEEIIPLLPTGIGEQYCKTISNLEHAALLHRCELPL